MNTTTKTTTFKADVTVLIDAHDSADAWLIIWEALTKAGAKTRPFVTQEFVIGE